MLIDKNYIKEFKTLKIHSVTGGNFPVSVEEISKINCKADNTPLNTNTYRVWDGIIELSSKGSRVLGEVFDEEELELNRAYEAMAGEGLYLQNFFRAGCDVNGFSLVRENGEEIKFTVPYDPLAESIYENIVEYSNCPSAQTDYKGRLTLYIGKSSKAPVRKNNNFHELVQGWEECLGDYRPNVFRGCMHHLRCVCENKNAMTIAVETMIFNKGAKERVLPLIFYGCGELNLNFGYHPADIFELNMSRLYNGNIFVDFVGGGINFECESLEIDRDTLYSYYD